MTKLFFISILIFGVVSAVTNSSWCPSNGMIAQSDGTCLVAIHVGTQISHVGAASRCRSYSTYRDKYQLLTVKTPQKHIDVQSWISSHPMRPRSGWLFVWLNLEREFTTQSADLSVWRRRTDWRWRDGDSNISDALSDPMWGMWRTGEPNNFKASNEYCVHMILFDDSQIDKAFNDASCSEQLEIPSMIICEKMPPVVTTTQTTTTTSSTSTTSASTTTMPLSTTIQSTSSESTSMFLPKTTLLTTQLVDEPYSAAPNSSWCPTGGLIARSDGTCLVALHVGTKISHADASSRCRSYSSHRDEYQLPTIKTRQKHADIFLWLSQHPMSPPTGWLFVWLNLEREVTAQSKNLSIWRRRTDWRWRDGNSSVTDAISEDMWSMWRSNEPNNYQDSKEYCVRMILFDSNQRRQAWADAPCGLRLEIQTMTVCEKKPPMTS